MEWVQLFLPCTDKHLLPEFRSALRRELAEAGDNLQCEIREREEQAGWHFHCVSWPRRERTIAVHEAWLFALARAIRAYAAAKEKEVIRRYILSHDCYDRVTDKTRMIQYVQEIIKEQETGETEYEGVRIHRIEKEAIRLLEDERVLQLDGFFRFRLRSYMNELCAMIDTGIELYIAEEEQEQLIRRLQAFLLAFPRRSKLLRVVHTSLFSFRYYNEGWELLSPPKMTNFPLESEASYIAEEVKTIGVLAGFAPEYIMMYTSQPNHEFIRMLTKIFAGRIDIHTDFSFPAHIGQDT
ncbi:hypothetical protein JQN58_14320 [Aneurinibacillus sp. BA2021]|nr:hypothetical protein [Aneurinibacillus sp. BA2021]